LVGERWAYGRVDRKPLLSFNNGKMMIQMNVNAMTNAEISAEYHSLVKQGEQFKRVGRAIIGPAFTDKIAFLKAAMDEKGLT
jgi:hypothetical protein